ncbi:MAG: TatD family hydrolase [Phycisphaerae bacterium]
MLIDTHCHLTYEGLVERQADIVQRAAAVGVDRMITVGTHPADHPRVLETVAAFAGVSAALGIHPHHAEEVSKTFLEELRWAIRSAPRVLAIGECGLDYHGNSASPEAQKSVFIAQINLAAQLRLPLILHVRDAHSEALAIMRDYPGLPFVVHCFTGTPEQCVQWLELGAYIGFTGVITYKNASAVRASCQLVPRERLVIETDAPYLTPQAVRKIKLNEPAFVIHVAQRVGAERGWTLEQTSQITTANAIRLFGMA